MDVAVTGSSGLIGSALRRALEQAGHRVVRVVRGVAGPGGSGDTIRWDPAAGTMDAAGLEGIGAVVHLAGEGIGDRRWSDAQRARILDSRVQGTTLLAETLAKLQNPPATLVSGSAVGFYGDRGDETLDEDSASGRGFLADVCRQWEAATAPAEQAGVRVAHLRTGIVLSPAGGVLKKMVGPFKLGLGGRIGSGKQWMSWITIDDEVGAILHVLATAALSGPVNATAPNSVTNEQLTKALGQAVGRPTLMPLPAVALRLALGQMAEELLLGGQRVLPKRLLDSGYAFTAPDVEAALQGLLRRAA